MRFMFRAAPVALALVLALAGTASAQSGQKLAFIRSSALLDAAPGRAEAEAQFDPRQAVAELREIRDYLADPSKYLLVGAAAPKGVDVYFDNVGGDILEACLAQMNNRGRIACCGAISQYDGVPSAHGPRGVPGLIVVKRLIMQGFIVMDYMDQRDQALAELQSWVASGKLKVQEDVIDGLENTPKALIGLLAGENRGKRMIRV